MNAVALALCVSKNFFTNVWIDALAPYARSFFSSNDAEGLAFAALNKCEEAVTPKDLDEDEDHGEDLCNCKFSLAYGAKILLNRTALRLKRGRRYGLCGANGCGKSTLMRAISNEQFEGFPPRSALKTVYVEHDIDGSEADTPLVEFMLSSTGVETQDAAEVKHILLEYGFSELMVTKMAIGELSGGWKMKLVLARAMLMNADILLLNEPTNYLDVVNVAWLENYLLGLKTMTSIIVSHDFSFLDHVCSDIIHYEPNYKLKCYNGNLSQFVKKSTSCRLVLLFGRYTDLVYVPRAWVPGGHQDQGARHFEDEERRFPVRGVREEAVAGYLYAVFAGLACGGYRV